MYLVDNIITNPNHEFAINALIIMGLFLLFLQILYAIYQYKLEGYRVRVNTDITIHIRMLLTKKLEKINMKFFRKTDHGTIFHRYTNDIEESQSVLFGGSTSVTIDAIRMIFGIIALFILNLTMSIIVLAILPFYVYTLKKSSSRLIGEEEKIIKKRSIMYDFFYEFIRSGHMIKAYVLDSFTNRRMEKKMGEYADEVVRFAKVRIMIEQVTELIGSIGPLVILVYGGYQIILGNFTIGALMAFTQFIPYVFGSAAGIVSFSIDLEKSYPHMKSMFSVLEYEEEIEKGEEFTPIKSSKIVFDNVSYEIDGKPILTNVSLTIPENTTVAIVGKSGAGKTSTLRMIEGFWYPESGSVLVGGENTKEADIRSIRSTIGYVSQESLMLKDTVYKNIALSRDISIDEVKSYAKMAQIHDFIEKLPKKYDTIIDPEEINLSGGQLQRISLARALAQEKSILLLDEFSSEIDPATEKKILKTLDSIHGKKTIVIIAHDKSCVVNADKVFVIDTGRLVEEGKPKSLFAKKGSFLNKVFQ
jgi:subfamily B ATP-binding cassette protein MsbA